MNQTSGHLLADWVDLNRQTFGEFRRFNCLSKISMMTLWRKCIGKLLDKGNYGDLRLEDAPTPAPVQPTYDPRREPPPLGDLIQRGEAAARLLNDPTLAESVEELRKDIFKDWFMTKPEETGVREALYRDAYAIERMVNKLITYRTTGSMKEAIAEAERAADKAMAEEEGRRG